MTILWHGVSRFECELNWSFAWLLKHTCSSTAHSQGYVMPVSAILGLWYEYEVVMPVVFSEYYSQGLYLAAKRFALENVDRCQWCIIFSQSFQQAVDTSATAPCHVSVQHSSDLKYLSSDVMSSMRLLTCSPFTWTRCPFNSTWWKVCGLWKVETLLKCQRSGSRANGTMTYVCWDNGEGF